MKIGPLLELLSGASEGTSAILAASTHKAESIPPRLFKGEELERVVGVSSQTIYAGCREGRIPELLKDERGRRIGATLEQVLAMQEYFGTSPRRRKGDPPLVIPFTTFKGGAWKSTTTWYAGSYFANLGLRVLLVDLDPQASLTLYCGYLADINIKEEDSLANYITLEDGFIPEFVDATIKTTYLPNMDLIPSSLSLAAVEMVLATAIMQSAGELERVRDAFFRVGALIDQVKDKYDLVLIDGTPSLGLIPLNIIFAADSIIVPTPSEYVDFASTAAFCELYADQAEKLSDAEGAYNVVSEFPDIWFLPTRYSDSETRRTMTSKQVLAAIKKVYGEHCLGHAIRKHDGAVSNLSAKGRTVFDIRPGQAGVERVRREAIMAARDNYAQVFDEIIQKVIVPKWPSRRTLR